MQTSPTIDFKLESITRQSGQGVNLPCVAHAYPLPRYQCNFIVLFWQTNVQSDAAQSSIDNNCHQWLLFCRYVWFKDGKMMTESNNIHIIGGSLQISTLTPSDAGVYTCNASNFHGSSVANSNLIVTGLCESSCSPNFFKL